MEWPLERALIRLLSYLVLFVFHQYMELSVQNLRHIIVYFIRQNLSNIAKKSLFSGFPSRSDTNLVVQPKKHG